MSCTNGAGWWRPPDVSNDAQGVADCASSCAGYTYFGLECPRSTVHCQCSNTLSGTKADVIMCQSGQDTCIGPYQHGPYMMGGSDHGSVYYVTPVVATVGLQP